MAPQKPDTPKASADKPVESGVSKLSPAKSPNMISHMKGSILGANKDLLFLWKCITLSNGMKAIILKIDWAAVSEDAGKSVPAVKKQFSRLNLKCEKTLAALTEALDQDLDEKVDPGMEAPVSE
ncbi:hypothetical protein N7457_009662 [Penicillium paradoxum]|uniref:uncharacterized protein n=1 Tax=Penicillium paradoxum TaxID=176176 RepID=UPI002546E66C|nr:uncharacterized protein N7457_009662 [Penicillium paradoxum]KAJ5774766.1 hypothetical protein N7457_009662 [Penicillium paradoxum]